MTAIPLPRIKIYIIYVICEARQPISRSFITALTSQPTAPVNEIDVQEVLTGWQEFLHEERLIDQKQYSLYHASFRDFLHRQDIIQAASVTLQDIHGNISDYLLAQLGLDL